MSLVQIGVHLGCAQSGIGTLGFFARFPSDNRYYAVTCSHSIDPKHVETTARPNADAPGECLVHVPGSILTKDTTVGELIWAQSLHLDNPVASDCAVVRLNTVPSFDVPGIGLVADLWRLDSLPTQLRLVFRGVLLIGTLVTQERLAGPVSLPDRPDGAFTYRNIFAVEYDDPPQGGMSGAGIVTEGGQLVGLHVAGSGRNGFFHRADELLDSLEMEFQPPI